MAHRLEHGCPVRWWALLPHLSGVASHRASGPPITSPCITGDAAVPAVVLSGPVSGQGSRPWAEVLSAVGAPGSARSPCDDGGGHEVGSTAESVHSLDWFQARLGRRFLRGQDLYAATSVLTWPARLGHAVSLNPSGSPASW